MSRGRRKGTVGDFQTHAPQTEPAGLTTAALATQKKAEGRGREGEEEGLSGLHLLP